MGRSHYERPQSQVAEAHAHAYPLRMAGTNQTIATEAKNDRRRAVTYGLHGQIPLRDPQQNYHNANRKRMSQRNGQDRSQRRAAALLLHPQRYGKEPSHRGVDYVISSETQKRQPKPPIAHT